MVVGTADTSTGVVLHLLEQLQLHSWCQAVDVLHQTVDGWGQQVLIAVGEWDLGCNLLGGHQSADLWGNLWVDLGCYLLGYLLGYLLSDLLLGNLLLGGLEDDWLCALKTMDLVGEGGVTLLYLGRVEVVITWRTELGISESNSW